MADLSSLIRLRKHTVEEKQKALAELYRQAEALEARKKFYHDEIKKEREVINQNPIVEMLAYFGLFQKAASRPSRFRPTRGPSSSRPDRRRPSFSGLAPSTPINRGA